MELRPAVGHFLEGAARALGAGFVVTIDYGAWRGRSQLHELTLRGYFRHERRSDLLARAGKQDLTADVDFAALDSHGRRLGFETLLFLDLASFLAAGGAASEIDRLRLAAGKADALVGDAEASLLEALSDPADVGGLFKVMVQAREGT